MNPDLHHVSLPKEFITLLKTNLSSVTSPSQIFNTVRKNKAIYFLMERTFSEFDDGRGLEKTMLALGWPNFRERMASLYVYKATYGSFPSQTDLKLVEDITELEKKFSSQGVQSYSRLFLLGFYIKLLNLSRQQSGSSDFVNFSIPDEMAQVVKLSAGRSEKIDWLILIVLHLQKSLGAEYLINSLNNKKSFEDLYPLMTEVDREQMCKNLLAYAASIDEQDIFLYEKV